MLTGCPLKCCIATSEGKGIGNRKTWIDNIKEDVKIWNMDIRVAAEMTTDREK